MSTLYLRAGWSFIIKNLPEISFSYKAAFIGKRAVLSEIGFFISSKKKKLKIKSAKASVPLGEKSTVISYRLWL